jgi:ribosomal protein L32
MGEPGDQTSLSRRRKRRRSRAWQAITTIWAEWRVEIVVVILVLLAIFLLVEHVQLRQMAVNGVRQGLKGVDRLVAGVLQGISDFVQDTTLSDLTAYVLLLIAFAFAVFRVRWRLVRLRRLQTRECPRCGGELHRIHRHTADRLLSLYVPVRRYQCKNDGCRWQGLRVRTEDRR